MLKRCPPKKDEINDAARNYIIGGRIHWLFHEKSRKSIFQNIKCTLVEKLTEKVKRINWSIHSTKTCAKEKSSEMFLSGDQILLHPLSFHLKCSHRSPEVFTMVMHSENEKHIQCAALMRNGNNLIQSADSITYSISNWRNY